jgi:2-oxoglutarate ferredoxin oxidoreductase subunit delta
MAKQPRLKATPKIHVDVKRCTGCGICVEFCSQGVFAKDVAGKAEVVKPGDCNMCRLCELYCSDLCIQVEAGS